MGQPYRYDNCPPNHSLDHLLSSLLYISLFSFSLRGITPPTEGVKFSPFYNNCANTLVLTLIFPLLLHKVLKTGRSDQPFSYPHARGRIFLSRVAFCPEISFGFIVASSVHAPRQLHRRAHLLFFPLLEMTFPPEVANQGREKEVEDKPWRVSEGK